MIVIIIVAIGAIALFAWSEQQRQDALARLEETAKELEEVRTVSQRTSNEATQEILGKVVKLIKISLEPRPTVATITDIDALRQTNPFYQKAENGDHLIITENRAILYDPDENIILDVVPVQIQVGDIPAEGEEPPTQPSAEGEVPTPPEGDQPTEVPVQ